ncbi:hypothetical protein M0R04_03385 [Candidatus Dojkabacteria bacterium]|jgi:hypothetical protein|nr:hypothetical protein [Candidatus Dojkabacteria bacterium]
MKNFKLPKVISPKALIVFFIVVGIFALIPVFFIKANALTAVYFFLSRMATSIDGSTNTVVYTIAVAPNQTMATGGTMTIKFPDADDGFWCHTNGSLTITGVASALPDLAATNWAIDSALPNSGSALTATCTKGTGASSVDTIAIANIGTLTGGTTYGFTLANGSSAGVIGTDDTAGSHTVTLDVQSGVIIDSGTFDLYLVSTDTVTVSATVQAVPTVNCAISSTSVSLGTLFPGGAFNSITNTLTTSTSSSANGYYWSAFGTGDGSTDAGLYKSTSTTYLIPSTGSGTINLNTVGVQGFGITLSDPDAAGAAVVPADFSDSSFGTVGALDRLYTGAQIVLYQNGAQTSSENSTVTYVGKAGGSAEAGSYQEVIYFQCGGYY